MIPRTAQMKANTVYTIYAVKFPPIKFTPFHTSDIDGSMLLTMTPNETPQEIPASTVRKSNRIKNCITAHTTPINIKIKKRGLKH